MTLLFAILTKNASFRSYGTFAYLLRAHIRNIIMRRHITSARGHELSGRVRTRAYNYYAWAECCGLQIKLLVTPLSERSHIIILQVWCSLTSVTTTLGLLFSWLHILHCTVVITLENLALFPSYSCLVYMIL